ncbi:MAG: hypothetical protein JWP36_704 [Paucimonas sp.]|jgi:hypothetical protein|nr:hypothetical protein [Paucimonas sp.]
MLSPVSLSVPADRHILLPALILTAIIATPTDILITHTTLEIQHG